MNTKELKTSDPTSSLSDVLVAYSCLAACTARKGVSLTSHIMKSCACVYTQHVLTRSIIPTLGAYLKPQLDFTAQTCPSRLQESSCFPIAARQRLFRKRAWSCALLSAWKREQSAWPWQAGPARALLGLMYAQLPPLSAHTGTSPAQRTGALRHCSC